jgi:hypothetical protein
MKITKFVTTQHSCRIGEQRATLAPVYFTKQFIREPVPANKHKTYK